MRKPPALHVLHTLAVLLMLALTACAAAPTADTPAAPASQAGATPAGIPGLPQLDTACRVDSDCEVKNVGNCCGYYPACVNKAAQPDPEAVMARCADTGMASVCGFQDIQACSCVDSQCQPVRQSLNHPVE